MIFGCMSLGARIKLLREKQGLTQKQLALTVGIAQKNISAYESDAVNPSALIVKKLAVALQTDANYLLDIPSNSKAEHPLMPRLRDIESLAAKERSALLTIIDTFLEAYRGKDKKQSNAYKKSKN